MQGKEGSNILETNSQPKGPILQLRNSINFNDELFVSINTIRNHVANIYKKTGMKKKELKEKCFYKTN